MSDSVAAASLSLCLLLALLGAQSSLLDSKLQFALLLAALASFLATFSESLQNKSPPVSLVQEIQQISNKTGEGTVLILNTNASRHAMWYLPDAEVIMGERMAGKLDVDKVFSGDRRVFSHFYTSSIDDRIEAEELAIYRRSYRVWMRHTSTGASVNNSV